MKTGQIYEKNSPKTLKIRYNIENKDWDKTGGQIVRDRWKQSWGANHKRGNPKQEVTDETKGEDRDKDNKDRPN